MWKRFYRITRDLHLYLGLFLSPLLVVFAASVIYLVHPGMTQAVEKREPRTVSDIAVREEWMTLTGRPLAEGLRPLLERLGVRGEINFIRRMVKERRLVIPVMVPGKETRVEVDLAGRTATVTEVGTGTADALAHLHKMPGPHNAALRGNSLYMRVWRVLADVSTYGLLFLTLSGIYLWTALRAERRVGLVLLTAGVLTFCGMVYALLP